MSNKVVIVRLKKLAKSDCKASKLKKYVKAANKTEQICFHDLEDEKKWEIVQKELLVAFLEKEIFDIGLTHCQCTATSDKINELAARIISNKWRKSEYSVRDKTYLLEYRLGWVVTQAVITAVYETESGISKIQVRDENGINRWYSKNEFEKVIFFDSGKAKAVAKKLNQN